jgi:hypothetical protein
LKIIENIFINLKHKTLFKLMNELKTEIEQLKKENLELKEKLNKYTNPIFAKNYYENKGDCIIEFNKVGETIVDKEIYYDLIKYKWYLNNYGYVHANINNQMIKLHRYIMNYTGNNYIDHINNNPLDNRKCNLRIVTPAQNMMNQSSSKNSSSKYIGVGFDKRLNNWRARIHIDGKEVFLGRFKTEIEAAKARDKATKEHFGEFGKLNFLM